MKSRIEVTLLLNGHFNEACPKYIAMALDTSTEDDLPYYKITFEIVNVPYLL